MNEWMNKRTEVLLERTQIHNKCCPGLHRRPQRQYVQTYKWQTVCDCMWSLDHRPGWACMKSLPYLLYLHGRRLYGWVTCACDGDRFKRPGEETFNAQPPASCFSVLTTCIFQHTRTVCSVTELACGHHGDEFSPCLLSEYHTEILPINRNIFWILQYLWGGSADEIEWLQT